MLTAADLLAELRRVVDETGPEITLFRFQRETGIHRWRVYDRWGNWTNLRLAAGLSVRNTPRPVYSDDELLAEFNGAVKTLDKYPLTREFDRESHRSWGTLWHRFGRKREIVNKHRDWLEKQPDDLRPGFLVGCPADCDPTGLPGVHMIKPEIEIAALENLMSWLPEFAKK
ncbi:MAG TPA: hypothetical protein VM165_25225, partial [Planctomycetaceae bacterium]|nr:hypothetical protein [Planctomycetaceae bacterium]